MDMRSVRSGLATRIEPAAGYDGRSRPAAVLVVIYGGEPTVLMTKKPDDLRVHAGEISFPGGKPEACDSDLLDTALRETREEIGLHLPRGMVVGQLEPVMTQSSGFRIVPFVAAVPRVSGLGANREVEQIYRLPLEPLLRTMADDPDPGHRLARDMFVFSFEGVTVWGASARILHQIAGRLM